MIELGKSGEDFRGYLAVPPSGEGPGIVLLQEIFGVNAYVRGLADRLASAGYFVLAPDLFWRQAPGIELDAASEEQRARAMVLFKTLDEDLAVGDAARALEWLRLAPGCSGKVGALGYCLGGKIAYLMAARSDVDSAIAYYGVGIQAALDEAAAVNVPVLLHVAADDALCPPEAQAAIRAKLESFDDIFRLELHEGAGHAFARPGPGFDAAATERADRATMTFLADTLS